MSDFLELVKLINSQFIKKNYVPFKIKYKFQEDDEYYTCILTYNQFQNFKELPLVKECEIVKEEPESLEEYKKEVQEAINLAAKNYTSHIKKLSQTV